MIINTDFCSGISEAWAAAAMGDKQKNKAIRKIFNQYDII
jgi:hypothetical protein